jgi:chromosome segregation ATPase
MNPLETHTREIDTLETLTREIESFKSIRESFKPNKDTFQSRRSVNKNGVYRAANDLLQQGIQPKIKELQLYFKERGQSPSNSTLSDAMQTFFVDLAKDRGSELMSNLDLLESDGHKAAPDDPTSSYFSEDTKKALLDALLQIKSDMFRDIDQRRQVLEDQQAEFLKGHESRTTRLNQEIARLQEKLSGSNEQVAQLIKSDMVLRGVIHDLRKEAQDALEKSTELEKYNSELISSLSAEVSTLKDSLEHLTDQASELTILSGKLKDSEKIGAVLEDRLKTLQDTNRAALSDNTELLNKQESLEERLASTQDRLAALGTEIREKDGIISGLSETNNRLSVKLEYSQEFAEELRKTLNTLQMPITVEKQAGGVDDD